MSQLSLNWNKHQPREKEEWIGQQRVRDEGEINSCFTVQNKFMTICLQVECFGFKNEFEQSFGEWGEWEGESTGGIVLWFVRRQIGKWMIKEQSSIYKYREITKIPLLPNS